MKFVLNQVGSATTKRIKHTDGREYLIVPDVAIVEGVMNNVLYLEEEMARYIEVWNGKPLTLGHPQKNGEYVSANSPDIFANTIGFFFNASFENGRLKGEWWIDVEKAEALGGEALTVLERLEAGEILEQSTGLFFDLEETSGVYKGKPYQGIARNLRPDHLAILLDAEGACSIKDGCGAPRVNRKGDAMEINVELSLDEKLSRVYEAWYETFSNRNGEIDIYIRDVFETFVVARDGDKLFSYPYQVDTENNIEFGEPVEIEMVYQEVESGVQINALIKKVASELFGRFKESFMNEKEKLVKSLVANERCAFPQSALEGMDLETLKLLEQSLAANEDGGDEGEGADGATPPAEGAEGDEPPNAETQPPPPTVAMPAEITQFAEMLRDLGGVGRLKEALSGVVANAGQERQQYIEVITANSALTEDDLKQMSTEQLSKLSGSFGVTPDYSGRGAFRVNQPQGEWVAWESSSNNGGEQ